MGNSNVTNTWRGKSRILVIYPACLFVISGAEKYPWQGDNDMCHETYSQIWHKV